jgi:alkylated DNA repair dioxygenase AlkB
MRKARKYRFLNGLVSQQEKDGLIEFFSKYSDYHDGINFLDDMNGNEWFIASFDTIERKNNFWTTYWRTDERRDIWSRELDKTTKPWWPTIWPDLADDSPHKLAMEYIKDTYKSELG